MSLDVVSVSARRRRPLVHERVHAHERAQVTHNSVGRAGGRCCCHMCTSCFQTTHICASSSPGSAGESRRPTRYRARLPCCIQHSIAQRATCSVAAASAHPIRPRSAAMRNLEPSASQPSAFMLVRVCFRARTQPKAHIR